MTDEEFHQTAYRIVDGLIDNRWPGHERLAVEASIVIRLLVEEHKRLLKAVRYYADESNYNEDGAPVHRTSPMLDYESEEQDWGGVAREALEAKNA